MGTRSIRLARLMAALSLMRSTALGRNDGKSLAGAVGAQPVVPMSAESAALNQDSRVAAGPSSSPYPAVVPMVPWPADAQVRGGQSPWAFFQPLLPLQPLSGCSRYSPMAASEGAPARSTRASTRTGEVGLLHLLGRLPVSSVMQVLFLEHGKIKLPRQPGPPMVSDIHSSGG